MMDMDIRNTLIIFLLIFIFIFSKSENDGETPMTFMIFFTAIFFFVIIYLSIITYTDYDEDAATVDGL